jgi:hypothetical protein
MLMHREQNSGQNHDRNSLKLRQNSNLLGTVLKKPKMHS